MYSAERRVFRRLCANCTPVLVQEFELAFNTLIERYNTTVYENRFVVGGAVEVFIYALLRAVKIGCIPYGDQTTDGDILLPNEKKLSVKGSFTGGAANVRLMNKQGKGTRAWATATLFVISEVGLVYGDPDMVESDHIKDAGDAIILKRQAVKNLIEDKHNVIKMNLKKKPPTEITGSSEKASAAVAKVILRQTKSTLLLKAA